MVKTTERRRHKRVAIICPAALLDGKTDAPLDGRTINLSDGGVLLTVPAKVAPAVGRCVTIKLMVPRTTPNTYMLEEFVAEAKTVRLEESKRSSLLAAMEFLKDLNLDLEV